MFYISSELWLRQRRVRHGVSCGAPYVVVRVRRPAGDLALGQLVLRGAGAAPWSAAGGSAAAAGVAAVAAPAGVLDVAHEGRESHRFIPG